jgi:hypothetical protein
MGKGAEVHDMCITEFDKKVYEKGIRQEARNEDIENMLKRGKTRQRRFPSFAATR